MNYKKNKNDIHKGYWDNKYTTGDTGWDLGEISSPLKNYIDQLRDYNLKILVPGAGNSYEAEYLFKNGFKNVYVLDISEQPLLNFKKRVPEFPADQLIQDDYWKHQGSYDLVLEQTFFCAIHPELRNKYADRMHQLLKDKGKLTGVLFAFDLTATGPPFGGSLQEYQKLFQDKFKIKVLKTCYNSIKPRKGNELFFIFEKK